MLSSRGKKIFLISSVVVPFAIYCYVYYAPIIRNAPFKAKEFVSLEYKWGVGEKLENSYNSATGEYRYLDNNDSLIVKNVKLNEADQKFLDHNADEQGFWNLPDIVANNAEDVQHSKAPRFFMKFNYQKKSKEVLYLSDFKGNERMKSAAAKMQKIIEQQIMDAETRADQVRN